MGMGMGMGMGMSGSLSAAMLGGGAGAGTPSSSAGGSDTSANGLSPQMLMWARQTLGYGSNPVVPPTPLTQLPTQPASKPAGAKGAVAEPAAAEQHAPLGASARADSAHSATRGEMAQPAAAPTADQQMLQQQLGQLRLQYAMQQLYGFYGVQPPYVPGAQPLSALHAGAGAGELNAAAPQQLMSSQLPQPRPQPPAHPQQPPPPAEALQPPLHAQSSHADLSGLRAEHAGGEGQGLRAHDATGGGEGAQVDASAPPDGWELDGEQEAAEEDRFGIAATESELDFAFRMLQSPMEGPVLGQMPAWALSSAQQLPLHQRSLEEAKSAQAGSCGDAGPNGVAIASGALRAARKSASAAASAADAGTSMSLLHSMQQLAHRQHWLGFAFGDEPRVDAAAVADGRVQLGDGRFS
mmetsp:Transcript_23324/g.59950  ORF Transcript_23324/g.59950 Transcript_23324/m.59950 type:complete len:410 (+) Transcript_23324:3-1232(+)